MADMSQSSSKKAKLFSSLQGFDVQERFLSEARTLLEIACGRRSLTTIQALLILYACYVGQGRDRGGLQYRYLACDMFKREQVNLERNFENPPVSMGSGKVQNRYKNAISRALWGFYCFERYVQCLTVMVVCC